MNSIQAVQQVFGTWWKNPAEEYVIKKLEPDRATISSCTCNLTNFQGIDVIYQKAYCLWAGQ